MGGNVDVSIVVPCYNCASTLGECLKRVFENAGSFEVILVDDASTDETPQIATSFPVRYFRNETNRGPSSCRNFGVSRAAGGIILLIDSDVLIAPDSLERIRTFFREHPDLHVLQGRYSDASYYNDAVSRYKNYKLAFRELSRTGSEVAFINTSIVALRKSVFDRYRFDEQLRRAEDSMFGWNYARNGHTIILDKNFQAIHLKKHTLASFLSYQFHSGKDLVRNWIYKDMSKAILSGTNSLSNRLQLLRAPLSLLFLFALICVPFVPFTCGGTVLAALLLLSILLQLDFLLYVVRIDGWKMAAAAILIYLLDGLASALGVLAGLARLPFEAHPAHGRSKSVPPPSSSE